MAKQVGNTSVKDFDFTKSKNLNEYLGGDLTFKIKDYGLLDTQYGVCCAIIDDEGNSYHTYAEVIVNAVRKSFNTGIKLINRIATLKRNNSDLVDEDSGEVFTYLTLEEANPEEKQQWREAKKIRNQEAFKQNQESKENTEE